MKNLGDHWIYVGRKRTSDLCGSPLPGWGPTEHINIRISRSGSKAQPVSGGNQKYSCGLFLGPTNTRPMKFISKTPFGYAFVNLVSPDAVRDFWPAPPRHICRALEMRVAKNQGPSGYPQKDPQFIGTATYVRKSRIIMTYVWYGTLFRALVLAATPSSRHGGCQVAKPWLISPPASNGAGGLHEGLSGDAMIATALLTCPWPRCLP